MIKNNLESVSDQRIHLIARDPAPQDPLPTEKIYVQTYNNLPINQPELCDVSWSPHNPYDIRITMNDLAGIKPVLHYDYINQMSYKHLKNDTLSIADSLVADPPILIDPRLILRKVCQRPGGYSFVK